MTDWQVETVRHSEELEALREPWGRLQGRHFPTDPDAFRTILSHQSEVVRPHVLLLVRDGVPQTLLLGRLDDMRLNTMVGYKKVYAPRMRALTVVNEGVLGDDSEEVCRRLLATLRGSVGAGEADVLRLRNLRVGGAFHRVATSEPPVFARGYRTAPSVHWVLDLPSSFDRFLGGLSSSTRESVRRYGRKLTKEYGDRLELRVFRNESELDELFEQVGRVADKTYQGGLGVAFSGDPLQRELTRLAMKRRLFRAWVLFLNGEPCAFWHGETFHGVFRIGVPGYDPAVGHLRVGTYVLMQLIEDLCADEAVDTLDYGFGDAEYKRRFGTRNWLEEDVLVYALTAKGLRVNAVRTGLLSSSRLARRALRRGQALERLKRWWRRRLSDQAKGT